MNLNTQFQPTRNLNELGVKSPKWSTHHNTCTKYEPIESGRIFVFLEFSKRDKELWNYREGVLGNAGVLRGSNVVAGIWRNTTKRTKWKNGYLLFMPKAGILYWTRHTLDVLPFNTLFASDIFICSFHKSIQESMIGQSNFPLSKL